MKKDIMNQKFFESGQAVIVLLLTILVGLSIGLIVTQRTITDVTTSTQTEQSSRAFSAAEAGLERALSGLTSPGAADIDLTTQNSSKANVVVNDQLPGLGQAMETTFSKDAAAQFWLVDPANITTPVYPLNKRLFLYFGDPTKLTDLPAIETVLLIYDSASSTYKTARRLIETDTSRTPNKIGEHCDSGDDLRKLSRSTAPIEIPTTASLHGDELRPFLCRVQINTSINGVNAGVPIMLRVRLLYSSGSPQIALAPDTSASLFLPKQQTMIYSTGKSGLSQKVITVAKNKQVLSSFLDFALFSSGDIIK